MEIYIDGEFVDFNFEVYNNNGKISMKNGEKIDFDPRGKYIVPGFIDQHIHGAGNIDTMDDQDIDFIANILLKEGTTSFLPTTMTYDLNVVKEIIDKLATYKQESGANILGVHVEGPFIDGDKYIGAQNKEYIVPPSKAELAKLNQSNFVKMVTYAPELDTDLEMTKYMMENKIVGSIGHSGATMAQVEAAISEGANCFTHLHNASTGHHHRNPGVVSAAFANTQVAELIVDGIHIHPDAVKMTYKIKGRDGIILITDAMRAKGMNDGVYDLGGQPVTKCGHEARLENGALAGSVLLMNEAVKNMVNFSGCKLSEAVQMATYNPAKNLKVLNKGFIRENFDFDITVLDENLNVVETYVNGKREWRI